MTDEATILKWCKDRGSADRYYGRSREPHYYTGGNMIGGVRVEALSPDHVDAYNKGFNEEEDRKDWGSDYEPETESEDE